MVRPLSRYTLILFLLISIPSAYASGGEITIDYPSSVNVGETFSVSVGLVNFSPKIYDVKIDILDSNSARIAKILNEGTWKSTFYYVLAAIDDSHSSGQFELNITSDYEGVATINVTIRNGTSYKFGPYSLEINMAEIIPPAPEENSSEQENQSQEENETAEVVNGTDSVGQDSAETDAPAEDSQTTVSPTNKTSKTGKNASALTLPPSKTIVLNKADMPAIANDGGEIVYQSGGSMKPTTIAIYLTAILFVLMICYMILNKGKI